VLLFSLLKPISIRNLGAHNMDGFFCSDKGKGRLSFDSSDTDRVIHALSLNGFTFENTLQIEYLLVLAVFLSRVWNRADMLKLQGSVVAC
jgi:hypothetical protein